MQQKKAAGLRATIFDIWKIICEYFEYDPLMGVLTNVRVC